MTTAVAIMAGLLFYPFFAFLGEVVTKEKTSLVRFPAGLTVWFLLVEALDIAGLFSTGSVLVAFAVLGVFGAPSMARTIMRSLRIANVARRRYPEEFLAGLVILAWAILSCATPPFFYDALHYHLGHPLQYLAHGEIVLFSDSFFAYFPVGGKLIHTLPLALDMHFAPKIFHAATFLVCAGIFADLCRGCRHPVRTRRSSSWAGMLFLSLPAFLLLGLMVNTDLYVALFTLAIAALLRRGSPGIPTLVLLFAGLTNMKYTAYPIALILTVSGLVFLGSKRRLLFGAAGGVVIGSYSLARNYLETGNPFYPLLEANTPELIRFMGDIVPARLDVYGINLPALFWDMTVSPGNFGSMSLLGASLLITLPVWFFWFRAKKNRFDYFLTFSAVFYGFYWLGTSTTTRFYLAGFGLFFLATHRLAQSGMPKRLQKLSTALVVFTALFNLFLATYQVWSFGLLSTGDRTNIARRNFSPYDAYQWLNDRPETGTVVLLHEARPYYLRKPAIFASPFETHSFHRTVAASDGIEGIQEWTVKEGVSFVLINLREKSRYEKSGYGPYPPEWNKAASQRMERFFDEHTELVWNRDGIVIHKIIGDRRPPGR